MTYSSGMPILYPIGCVNFIILYWVYKVLLIKHYQITNSFNQDLPNFSISFYRIALIFHLLVGSFIYTNSKILSTHNIEWIDWLKSVLILLLSDDLQPIAVYFLNRFTSNIGLLYFLFIVLVILIYVVSKFGAWLLKLAYMVLCCACFGCCEGEK